MRIALLCLLLFASIRCWAGEAEAVVAHPPFAESYSCNEHWEGQFKSLGDALGTDCSIERLVEVNGRMWLRGYSGDGSRNEDWFSWAKDLLSPCTCRISKVNINPVVNSPGIVGSPPASFVMLERSDGVFFVLGHVAAVRVEVGASVTAGQVIAVVGQQRVCPHPSCAHGSVAWNDTAADTL